MRLAILLLLGSSSLFGQTITQTSTSTVTAVSGAVTCALTNSSPALLSGIHAACSISGALVLVMDAVVTPGNNGTVGSFTNAGLTITWLVNAPTGTIGLSWSMTAGVTTKSGVF